ncbi:MAG: porin [Pseudomonadota bacterium]
MTYKKMLLFVAVAPGFALAQSSNVEVYGILDAGFSHISNVKGVSLNAVDSGIWQAGRLGFRGKEDLGGGISALFVLEMGVGADTGSGGTASALFNRQSYVGLATPYGAISVGRQYDFLYVNSLPLGAELFAGPIVAGTTGGPGGTAGTIGPIDVHFGGYRYDNTIKWVDRIGPVTIGYMRGLGKEGAVVGSTGKVDSALIAYKDGPLSVGLGWTRDDFDAANSGNLANRVLAVKVNYKIGKFTVLGNYASAGSRNSRATNKPLEAGLAYQVAPQINIGVTLAQAKVHNAKGAETTLQQVLLGANYALSKRTSLYTIAARNHSTDIAVYQGFVGAPGGATSPSSTATQIAIRAGIFHAF